MSSTTAVKEFQLPDLGEGLVDAEIVRWLVAVGDLVMLNQPIVEVETAKATVEIPAKWAGTVAAIYHEAGRTVTVGTPIIAIETGAATPGGNGDVPVLVGYGPLAEQPNRRRRRARPLAKPPVRKLAKDLGVDLDALVGTGPSGSITRQDVYRAHRVEPPQRTEPAQTTERAQTTEPVREAIPVQRCGPEQREPKPDSASGGDRRIPIRGVRRSMAENMVASAFTAPHVTEFLTVDVTRSTRAIRRLRRMARWDEVRVSPLLFVAKASLLAIARYPEVNATWDGDSILVKRGVHLGIAVATDRGLLVPNIKDANTLSMYELAGALSAVTEAARRGRSTPADMTGGTFTITNVGVFGVDTGTPILPEGQAAILALGAVREAPWVHRGEVKPRMVATIGLSFDHRIVDGELGSRFLAAVGEFLTDPETALLAWS